MFYQENMFRVPFVRPPRPTVRESISPLQPLPSNLDKIIKDAWGDRAGLHFVYHNGYYTVWGRAAHYVAIVCNLSVHYEDCYAVTAWAPEQHEHIMKKLENYRRQHRR
jgi:hypothetical protein